MKKNDKLKFFYISVSLPMKHRTTSENVIATSIESVLKTAENRFDPKDKMHVREILEKGKVSFVSEEVVKHLINGMVNKL